MLFLLRVNIKTSEALLYNLHYLFQLDIKRDDEQSPPTGHHGRENIIVFELCFPTL